MGKRARVGWWLTVLLVALALSAIACQGPRDRGQTQATPTPAATPLPGGDAGQDPADELLELLDGLLGDLDRADPLDDLP